MNAKIAGVFLIFLAVAIIAGVAYRNSHKSQQPIVFSDRSMLDGLWHYHKKVYIDAQTGRTVDYDRGNSSTSEGEGYEMLRAVWWDDKSDFDRAWGWSKAALQHQNDHLFSWYYSQLPNGQYGINTAIGSQNTASDADQDIALALIFANDRWQDHNYLDAAMPIINDIWNMEVVTIQGKPYLAADNIEKNSATPTIVVNPSYFEPYAYKIFAKYDKSHDWNALADNSYRVLSDSMSMNLDKNATANLPPNWILVDKNSGKISPTNNNTLTTEYGFDAMRVPFRIGLDYMWFNDPRAKQLLSQMKFLNFQWQQNHLLYSNYGHDGGAYTQGEAPSVYGGSLAAFMFTDPAAAKDIYNNKLKVLYTPDTDSWKQQLSYYDDTWAWLGMAMYDQFTINLDQKNNG